MAGIKPPKLQWLVVPLCLLFSRVTLAHMTGVSYSDIMIGDRQVDIQLRVNLRDLRFASQLDSDQDSRVSQQEVRMGSALISSQFLSVLQVRSDSEQGQARLESLDYSAESGELVCRFGFAFRDQLSDLAIRFLPQQVTDPGHWNLAEVRYDRYREQFYFNLESSEFKVSLLRTPSTHFLLALRFAGLALNNIHRQPDLLIFAVVLLLIAVSWRDLWIPAGSLALAQLIAFVAAFELHQVVPSRFVGSALALSLVYIAAENLILNEVGYRGWIAAFFGLLYGLRFWTLFEEMTVPRGGVWTAASGFQAGILLSLAGITAIVFLLRIRRRAPDKGGRWIAIVSTCGLTWGIIEFVTRTF